MRRDDPPPKPVKPKGKPTERLARGFSALQRGDCELARAEASADRARGTLRSCNQLHAMISDAIACCRADDLPLRTDSASARA